MRHRSVVPRPRGGRVVAAASVVAMGLSAILLLAALRAYVAAAPAAPVAQPTAPPGSAAPPRTAPALATGASTGPDVSGDVPGDVTAGDVAQSSPRDRWRAVLALLDRRRAKAYAALRPRLLRRVYVPGAPVGRQDRELLGRYRERGLRVRGMRMRLLALQVRQRRGDRVALVVRERLAGVTVRGDGARGGPPADDVDVRLLVLRRVEGRGWRIGAVRPVAG